MILVRKSGERVRDAIVGQDTWHTFGPSAGQSFARFGNLELLKEGRFERRASVSEPRTNVEIITYVHAGALNFEDSMGLTGVLRQGDFQRTTAGTGLRYSEVNASSQNEAHVFQLWLRPDRLGLAPGHERKKFTFAERRGVLRLVASPAGVDGSLSIHQDAFLYSAILAKGQHLVHTIGKGRGAWIHIVQGALSVGDAHLETGDGVGLREEECASMFVTAPSEILLLDLGNFESNQMTETGRKEVKPGKPTNHGNNGAPLPKFRAEFL